MRDTGYWILVGAKRRSRELGNTGYWSERSGDPENSGILDDTDLFPLIKGGLRGLFFWMLDV
jgi:hypothetical protein